MRSLELSGPGEDGTSLVVRAEDGEQFVLPVDETLRAAVTSATAGHRTPASHGDNHVLTPREIQMRVRAGESPDELSDESGMELDRIMRFAFPVLEERARVADEARRSRARRDGDGQLVPFGDTVERRFSVHDIDPASVVWDAVRRPDGTWLVIATWHGGDVERQAHWAFSLNARTVLPADEVAGDLLSERPLRPVVRAVPDAPEQPVAPGAGEQQDHSVYDQESGVYRQPPPHYPGTPDPLPPAGPHQGWERPASSDWGPASSGPSAPGHDSPPLPLEFEPAERRHDRSRARDQGLGILEDYRTGPIPVDPDQGEADRSYADPSFAGRSDTGPASADAEVVDAEIVESGDQVRHSPADPEPTPAGPPPRRGGGRSKAAREQTKIPSWDDILLGVRRKQD